MLLWSVFKAVALRVSKSLALWIACLIQPLPSPKHDVDSSCCDEHVFVNIGRRFPYQVEQSLNKNRWSTLMPILGSVRCLMWDFELESWHVDQHGLRSWSGFCCGESSLMDVVWNLSYWRQGLDLEHLRRFYVSFLFASGEFTNIMKVCLGRLILITSFGW